MIYELIIPQFSKMLMNLTVLLGKAAQHAETKKFEVENLLTSRLAPDQFNLIRQVQIACDTAKSAAARLTGKEAPSHEDKEKTLADLKARIEKTVSYLQSFSAQDFEGAQSRRITTPRWEGKTLSGHEFVTQHAIPNLYFHVTTAYSILRHGGVDVGKKDFLGELPFKK
jgi:uncharacterized protein